MSRYINNLSWESIGKLSALFFILITLLLSIHLSALRWVGWEDWIEKNSSSFDTQYHLNEIKIEADIHERMQEVSTRTGADWVFFWGFHNGTEMGPFHINRMSVIDEIAAPGKRFQLSYLQNVSTAQYAGSLKHFWQKNTVRSLATDSLKHSTFKWAYESIGVFWSAEKAIKLWPDTKNPIGLIGLYFDEPNAEQINADPARQKEIKQQTEILANFITFQLQLKQNLDE